MKNFYRILQVDPEADKEIIEAAYKRLMRKYHPDVVSADERSDQSLLEKVQEINEAYHILSDDEKRKEYDKALKEHKDEKTPAAVSTVERRTYQVRCTRSKHTYRMLLARKRGTGSKFKIMGFELVEMQPPSAYHGNWLVKLSQNVLRKPQKIRPTPRTKHSLLSDDKVEELFDQEDPISLDEIDWTGENNCPDCGSELVRPSGSIIHWLICGSCNRLFCVGNATQLLNSVISTRCPWCGSSIRIGGGGSKPKNQWTIGGRDFSDVQNKEQNLFLGQSPKALGDGKK